MAKCIFCDRRGIDTDLQPGKKELNLMTKKGNRIKLREIEYNYCPVCNEDFYTEKTVQMFEKVIQEQ